MLHFTDTLFLITLALSVFAMVYAATSLYLTRKRQANTVVAIVTALTAATINGLADGAANYTKENN